MNGSDAHPSADIIPELYTRHAERFDADRSKSLFEKQWLDLFAGPLPQEGSILDLGCGSGEPIGAYLIRKGFSLTGCDVSPTLLKMAHCRYPDAKWIEADMRSLRLDDRFDGIIAWHSLIHLPRRDQVALIPRLAKTLNPRGRLLFTSGSEDGETIGEFAGEALYHASLDTTEYRALIEGAELELLAHRSDDPECGHANVWLAAKPV